jgi:hypothetical protein
VAVEQRCPEPGHGGIDYGVNPVISAHHYLYQAFDVPVRPQVRMDVMDWVAVGRKLAVWF